jgi:hypothetical protein
VIYVDDDDQEFLLDGRNRLDALSRLGLVAIGNDGKLKPADHYSGSPPRLDILPPWHFKVFCYEHCGVDPYSRALSLNVHRRHLTTSQKRELIETLLKRRPEMSDRQIGEIVKADGKTVAKPRRDLEQRADIPHVESRTDSKGRKQPSNKPERKPPPILNDKLDAALREAEVKIATAKAAINARMSASSVAIRDLPPMQGESFLVIDKCLKKIQASVQEAVDGIPIEDAGAFDALFDQLESCVALLRAEARRRANKLLTQIAANNAEAA